MRLSAWLAVAQRGLDHVAVMEGRDAIEAMLAVRVIAGKAGRLDAFRLAFEPCTSAAWMLRQRADAASLTRATSGAMRLVVRQRTQSRRCRHATGAASRWRC
jgi:hypothetical protein